MSELAPALKDLKEHENLLLKQTNELTESKKLNIMYETELSKLKEYKSTTEKELRNKNNTLLSAEQ